MTGTDDTLGLRVAAVFIVATVSLLGCLVTVIVGTKEQDSARTNRLLKCLGAGVIACVGFVHVLPDAAEMLEQITSYPLAYVVAMSGAFLLLVINQVLDYVFTSMRLNSPGLLATSSHRYESSPVLMAHDGHTHQFNKTGYQTSSTYQQKHPEAHHHHNPRRQKGANDHHHEEEDGGEEDGHCHRVHCDAEHIVYSFKRHPLLLAYIMELGIVFHSVIIGVGLGVVTGSRRAVQTLLVAICFHQFFEGAGLSACIVDADLGRFKTGVMIGVFSVTTSLGIVLGICISGMYDATSDTACLVQGMLNALASGILIYLTLVDMVAEEFGKREVRRDIILQLQMFAALIIGAGIMSVIAIWA